MLTLNKEIEKHIKKLVNSLKEEDELLQILKRKLTKKELKLLSGWAKDVPTETIQKELSLDEEQYATLSTKLIKKLNQEKLKQEICI